MAEGRVVGPKKPTARPTSTWQWNGRGSKEHERAIHEFRRSAAGDTRGSIVHHCAFRGTLANDFLRKPDLVCDAWEFAPDVSTQYENVTTFAPEKNQASNVGLALVIDKQRRLAIIAQTGLPLLPRMARADTRAEQCRMAGECFCGAEGWKLRSWFDALMGLIKF